jgi:hypothetical protein
MLSAGGGNRAVLYSVIGLRVSIDASTASTPQPLSVEDIQERGMRCVVQLIESATSD